MKTVLRKIDDKIRDKFRKDSYEEMWNNVWEEIAKFLAGHMTPDEVDQLAMVMSGSENEEEKFKKLTKMIEKIEMGKMRLLEKIIYYLDNYERKSTI